MHYFFHLTFVRFMYIVACISTLFSWLNNIKIGGIYYKLFIHSNINGHVGHIHLLTIVNGAAMNMLVIYLFNYLFLIFLGYVPRSGNPGSYGNSMLDLFEELQIVFQIGKEELNYFCS